MVTIPVLFSVQRWQFEGIWLVGIIVAGRHGQVGNVYTGVRDITI